MKKEGKKIMNNFFLIYSILFSNIKLLVEVVVEAARHTGFVLSSGK
ncbi:MAG: hypothetical protein HC797_06545 [Anaerolineales bacterium]|nr:hypothetical protein [Anaerolineales bacterium]